jgi:hypothetical protein
MNRPAIKYAMNKLKGNELYLVEIGVSIGENAVAVLTEFGHRIKKMYLIDPYVEFGGNKGKGSNLDDNDYYSQADQDASMAKMLSRMEKFHNIVKFIRLSSLEAAKVSEDEFFDFVYIDGNHEGEAVKQDMMAWYPKVKKTGFLAGHDYGTICKGLTKEVDNFAQSRGLILETFAVGEPTMDNSDFLIDKGFICSY